VPYVAGTLRDAVRQFCASLNRVLATTVTQRRLVDIGSLDSPNARRQIAFRQAGVVVPADLNTRFGLIELYVGQTCDSIPLRGGQRQLFTVKYRYTLSPVGQSDPLFRWEYDRELPDPWCRHHLQGTVPVQVGGREVRLNDWHLPTGYVPIEEILRFCIVDLGVRPLSDGWDEILTESYNQFRTDQRV